MSCIRLKPYYDMFCMEPIDTYPADAVKGCYINLQGHITDPDGMYIYNGNAWIIWKTL